MPPDHAKSKKELIAELEAVRQENAGLRKADAERKRAEETLKKSEEQLRAILDNATTAIYVKDLEGRFLLANKIIEKMFHLTQKDIIGKFDLDVFDKQTARQHLKNDRQVIETRKPARFDEAIVQDDEVHHFLSIKFPLLDASGTPIAVGGISTDITDLKRAEEALRESEERFKSLFQNNPVAYQSLDEEGLFLDVNPPWCAMMGYELEEVRGKSFSEFWTPQTRDLFPKRFNDFVCKGEVDKAELHLLKKNGEEIVAVLTGRVQSDSQGKFVRTHCILHDITDLKRAEEALRESEKRYRYLFENAPVGIVRSTATGRVLMINPAFAAIAGYDDPAEMVEGVKDVANLYTDPAQREEMKRLLAQHGELRGYEIQHKRKDGGSGWISFYAKTLQDTDGEVVFDGFIVDITEQKQAEEALRRNEARYALAQQAANIGSWEWDILTGDLHSSDRIEPMFGFGPGQFGGTYEAFFHSVHPEDRQLVLDALNASLEGQKDYAAEYRIVWPDGQVRWLAGFGKVQRDDKGRPVRMYGVVQDITERKKTEKTLRETLAELEAIFENSAMGILLLKGDRRIHRINSRCAEMLGYTEEEALGRTTRMVHTSDESFKAFGERVYPALVAGETAHAEHMLVRKDGTTVWCDFYGKALFPQELEKGSIWVFVDITERMELESLREDVERILRHDLRTPLSSVVGLPKVMLDDENLTPEQTGYLKLIQDAGYRMLNQINLSLDLYKMEMGTFQYQPNPVESNGLLKRLLHDLGLKAGGKGIGLEVLVKGVPWGKAESLQFQADEALCYTMLANLLDNAVDASPLGARVTLRLEEDPDAVAFSVHNIGTVPEAVRDNFFDKYATHGKPGGTGLGTYSAKLMTEAQGGSICMETSREEGTTVTIRLPKD